MKRGRIAVILLIVCLLVGVGFAFTTNLWVRGTVVIRAVGSDNSQYELTVDVYEQGRKVGQTSTPFSLPVGEHTLTFGSYTSDYDTPPSITVDVQFMKTTERDVTYRTTWGMLQVYVSKHDDYSQTDTQSDAPVFVDGVAYANGVANIKYSSNQLGSHSVAFAPIVGYNAPANRTVNVYEAQTISINDKYQKILTAEEQHYIWLRNYAGRQGMVLSKDSNLVLDKFYRWVLDSKISIPVCYCALHVGGQSCDFQYYIAQYAGILLNDKINSLDSICTKLNSAGANITYHGSINMMHYQDQGEYIVTVDMTGYRVGSSFVEQSPVGYIYCVDKTSMVDVKNLFPNIIPVGFEAFFQNTKGVYVKVGNQERPLSSVYDLTNFSNAGSGDIGGYYTTFDSLNMQSVINFYLSNSLSQLTQIIQTGIMGSVLVDFPSFCEGLLWQT